MAGQFFYMLKKYGIRHTIFFFATFTLLEGCLLPPWALALKVMLYPENFIRYYFMRFLGYDPLTEFWVINGVKYRPLCVDGRLMPVPTE